MKAYLLTLGVTPVNYNISNNIFNNSNNKSKILKDVVAIVEDDEDVYRYIKAKCIEEKNVFAIVLEKKELMNFFVSDKILQ